jgi:hypothetical protein
MIVFDLTCAHGHRFEGWFASADDYVQQRERSMVRCPMCDDAVIERRPSANVQVGRASAPAQTPAESTTAGAATTKQAEVLKMLRSMVEQSVDVGAAFPEEARKIHYDEAPARAIRGQASKEESAELAEEGIDVATLPDPIGVSYEEVATRGMKQIDLERLKKMLMTLFSNMHVFDEEFAVRQRDKPRMKVERRR